MASSEPTIYEPGEKPELTKVFLENNKSMLFIQESQWRGHGDLPALIRPRGNPSKIPRGTFDIPDQWVVVTVGVGDVGVTSCKNEREMLMQMFRNSASKGTSGLINLDQARDESGVKKGLPVRPGIFKQTEFDESNFDRKRKNKRKTIPSEKPQGLRVCPNFILTSDPTKKYFTGYTRNKWDLRSLDSSYDIVYPIKEDTGIKFENAGNIMIGPASEYLASGKGDPDIFQTSLHGYLRMLTSHPSLNNSSVKTDASYSWTYRELWSYSLNDLKLLLENVLLVHFRGPKDEWSQDVKDYIESLNKTELIKKICLYGKRLFISFNCSWLDKCEERKLLPDITYNYKKQMQEMIRTTTEMTDLMEQSRRLYNSKYRYIVEGAQRSKVRPNYNGQFKYKQICVKKFGLCVEDLSVYKEEGKFEGSIFARAAQSIAQANQKGKPMPEYPDEVMDAFRGNILKASDSTSSENSSDKRQRNRRRTEPIRRARSPLRDPEENFMGSFNVARQLANIKEDVKKEGQYMPIAEVSTTESLSSAKVLEQRKKRKNPKILKNLKQIKKEKKYNIIHNGHTKKRSSMSTK